MAKSNVRIELNDPNKVYRYGETLEGKVFVNAEKQTKIDALNLSIVMHVSGIEDEKNREFSSRGLAKPTTLKAGESRSYGFSLPIPNGPPSYDGKILSIDWALHAALDVPWAFDPKAHLEFIKGPGPDQVVPVTNLPKIVAFSSKNSKTMWSYSWRTRIGIVFFFLLTLAFVAAFSYFVSWLFLLAVAIPSLLAIAYFKRESLAKMRISDVDIDFLLHPSPGESTKVAVSFSARSKVEINQVNVALVAEEVTIDEEVVRRSPHLGMPTLGELLDRVDDGRYAEIRSVINIEERIEAQSMAANQNFNQEVRFKLPGDLPPSFNLGKGWLRWMAKVHIDIDNWPDVHFEREFLMPPHADHKPL